MDIVIWDMDARRINRIEKNLRVAMKQFGIPGLVKSMSEPPLIGRTGLLGKTPVLEIGNKYWSLKPGSDISLEQCSALLRKLQNGKELKKS